MCLSDSAKSGSNTFLKSFTGIMTADGRIEDEKEIAVVVLEMRSV